MADQAGSIFEDGSTQNQNTQGTQGTSSNANQDDLTTLLGAIKNERGEPKYKSVQDALKALQHSQEYIPTLKQTKDELEAQLQTMNAKVAKMEALEAVVLELTQKVGNTQNTPGSSLTEEQVAELVTKTLSKTQTEALQKQNVQKVVAEMKTKFGDKAEEVFVKKAGELGLSVAEFNAMAAKTPQAVLQLIGVGTTQTRSAPTGLNTDGFQPKPDSFIKRNSKTAMTGSTNQDLVEERQATKQMVEELHAQGLTVHDLTDPKVYNRVFRG